MLTLFSQVPASRARILCSDYRDIPAGTTYTKIVSLEMAEVRGILPTMDPESDPVC